MTDFYELYLTGAGHWRPVMVLSVVSTFIWAFRDFPPLCVALDLLRAILRTVTGCSYGRAAACSIVALLSAAIILGGPIAAGAILLCLICTRMIRLYYSKMADLSDFI